MTQQLSVQKVPQHPMDTLWWKPIFSLQREMNRTMRQTFANFMQPSFMPACLWDAEDDLFCAFQRNTHRMFSEFFNNRQMSTPWLIGTMTEPYIDIIENGNKFKIKADVPGMRAKDLEVSIADSAVTIRGERVDEQNEDGDTYIRRECHCGAFSRTIALPEEADVDKASVSFEQNVLTVEVPKGAAKSPELKIHKTEAVKTSQSTASNEVASDKKIKTAQ